MNPGHLLLSEQNLCTDAFYASLQGGHRLPELSKSLRLRAPGPGVKESKGSPSIFPIPTSGPITFQPLVPREGRWTLSALSQPQGCQRSYRSRPAQWRRCFLPAARPCEKAPRRSRKSKGESNSAEQPLKHRELKKQEARIRSRKDPFLPAALITGVAEASCSLRTGLCVCRHFRFASL